MLMSGATVRKPESVEVQTARRAKRTDVGQAYLSRQKKVPEYPVNRLVIVGSGRDSSRNRPIERLQPVPSSGE